jgi:hypothetical protein
MEKQLSAHYIKYKDIIQKCNKAYHEANKEKIKMERNLNKEKYAELARNYYKKNIIKLRETNKILSRNYYEKNIERVRRINLERYNNKKDISEICICGTEIKTVSKNIHFKSKKHQLFVNSKNNLDLIATIIPSEKK